MRPICAYPFGHVWLTIVCATLAAINMAIAEPSDELVLADGGQTEPEAGAGG